MFIVLPLFQPLLTSRAKFLVYSLSISELRGAFMLLRMSLARVRLSLFGKVSYGLIPRIWTLELNLYYHMGNFAMVCVV